MSFEPSRSASKVLYFLTMAAASSILQGQESIFLQSYACLRNWQDRIEIYILMAVFEVLLTSSRRCVWAHRVWALGYVF